MRDFLHRFRDQNEHRGHQREGAVCIATLLNGYVGEVRKPIQVDEDRIRIGYAWNGIGLGTTQK
jgi:hypothetical protein